MPVRDKRNHRIKFLCFNGIKKLLKCYGIFFISTIYNDMINRRTKPCKWLRIAWYKRSNFNIWQRLFKHRKCWKTHHKIADFIVTDDENFFHIIHFRYLFLLELFQPFNIKADKFAQAGITITKSEKIRATTFNLCETCFAIEHFNSGLMKEL